MELEDFLSRIFLILQQRARSYVFWVDKFHGYYHRCNYHGGERLGDYIKLHSQVYFPVT